MTEKEPQNILAQKLARLSSFVVVGAVYAHYKYHDLYKVLHLAINEADGEPYVVYQALYGDKVVFCRPAQQWLEQVEKDGKTVARFTLYK